MINKKLKKKLIVISGQNGMRKSDVLQDSTDKVNAMSEKSALGELH
jgi:hypothetical protein